MTDKINLGNSIRFEFSSHQSEASLSFEGVSMEGLQNASAGVEWGGRLGNKLAARSKPTSQLIRLSFLPSSVEQGEGFDQNIKSVEKKNQFLLNWIQAIKTAHPLALRKLDRDRFLNLRAKATAFVAMGGDQKAKFELTGVFPVAWRLDAFGGSSEPAMTYEFCYETCEIQASRGQVWETRR